MKKTILFGATALSLLACRKDDDGKSPSAPEPKLIVKLVLDPNQERLGNTGLSAAIPAGNAGQSPVFNGLSAHYLELAQGPYTALGKGAILYHAPETTKYGENAIDFSQAIVKKSNEVFLEIPLKNITPGEYEWVRLSLSYQNYDVQFYQKNIAYTGTLASFVGFNTAIDNYKIKIKTQSQPVGANKKQGFWGFESVAGLQSGQSAAGATTVPNPLAATSPIPAGSCVVTGKFAQKLAINNNETQNIEVVMNLSINKSFEWKDGNSNGQWDVDLNEPVVDMGLRGLIPSWQKR
jgi:hypothetical protein